MMMGAADHLAAMSREHASEQDALKAEITTLRARLEEARAENKRLIDGLEILANPEHWGAALNLSTSIGVKAWDFARALLNGSTK